jgi:hypothetical protein
MIGETSAARRRCEACLELLDRGEQLPDVPKETAAERDARLLQRDAGALVPPLGRVLRSRDAPAELHVAAARLSAELGLGLSVEHRYGPFRPHLLGDLELAIAPLLRRASMPPAVRQAAVELRDLCTQFRTAHHRD